MWTKELTDRCSASAIDARSALRLAIGALCVLAFSALSNVGALGATGPAAATARNHYYGTFTSGICTFRQLRIGSNRLVARLAKVQRYPAQADGVQGVVNFAFPIDRHGGVVSSRIVKHRGARPVGQQPNVCQNLQHP